MLVDEAYFHFYGETVMDLLGELPNLVVARTFSKAYGLAGLRVGLLASGAENMRWIRRVLSPYSVNHVALDVALPAALNDTEYLDNYVAEVLAARAEFETMLDAMGIRRWPSRANFVLVEIGGKHAEFVRRMNAAGGSGTRQVERPGLRWMRSFITVGTREQMRRAVEAMEAAKDTIEFSGVKR